MCGGMESLGRYPLSVILSYLSETEGTSLLITKRRYAYQLLPIFQLRDGLRVLNTGQTRRHKFVVATAQDATVLLARLNTRCLFRRRRPKKHGLTTVQLAVQEWHASSLEAGFSPQQQLLRFLEARSPWRARGLTLLASYPRSGNTLIRTLLERITGVVTGSDTRPDRDLSRELSERYGLAGESVTSAANVAFCKTHWPERVGNMVFEANRVVLLVRNPYDAIDSYWNMNATKSHTQSVTEAVYERFRTKYHSLVRNEINIWLKFHKYWLEDCPAVPVLVVRFEDMVSNPEREMARVLRFSLGEVELPLFWLERIRCVVNSGKSVDKLGSYQPRSAARGSKSIGKSLKKGHFTPQMIDYMRNESATYTRDYMKLFGYDIAEQGFPESFDYENLAFQPPMPTSSEALHVNRGTLVRPIDCPFGRDLRAWRHSVTNNDAEPLPTVG